jgi:chemotaxis signal transduction protein
VTGSDPLPAAAEATADPSADRDAGDAVVVHIGADRYAVPLPGVAEVGRAPALTRVPGLPSWVAGVANWRGRILPILDLGSVLGGETDAAKPRSRLVVLVDAGMRVGLLVDAIDTTVRLGDQIAPLPSALRSEVADLICGQRPDPAGPVAVLHVPGVMRLRDGLPRGRRSA